MEGSCQAEALARWIHPEKGMIYPYEFIPMLERSGKIIQLDLYIFEAVSYTQLRAHETKAKRGCRG